MPLIDQSINGSIQLLLFINEKFSFNQLIQLDDRQGSIGIDRTGGPPLYYSTKMNTDYSTILFLQ